VVISFQIVAASAAEAKRKARKKLEEIAEESEVPKGRVNRLEGLLDALVDALDLKGGHFLSVVIGDEAINVEAAKDLSAGE
jgi:hypothetical protein